MIRAAAADRRLRASRAVLRHRLDQARCSTGAVRTRLRATPAWLLVGGGLAAGALLARWLPARVMAAVALSLSTFALRLLRTPLAPWILFKAVKARRHTKALR